MPVVIELKPTDKLVVYAGCDMLVDMSLDHFLDFMNIHRGATEGRYREHITIILDADHIEGVKE